MQTMTDLRASLDRARGQWPKISRETGVDYFTIARIARGNTKAPRIDTVEKLQIWLAGNLDQDPVQAA